MEKYLVTFEQNGEIKSININARDVDDAKAKIADANGKVDYFNSICLNINDEEEE